MSGSKISLDPYDCAFNHDRVCPVRTMFKLKPESLVAFCKICPMRGTGETPSTMEATTADMISKATDVIFQLVRTEKEEKLALMDLVKTLSESLAKQALF